VALASFGTARDADLLAAYLDRYFCRPDLAYDQTVVMGALQFIDLNLGGGQADRFREPGGLWQQWLQDAPHMQGDSDPTPFLENRRNARSRMTECSSAVSMRLVAFC
jgi:hypothetical protein